MQTKEDMIDLLLSNGVVASSVEAGCGGYNRVIDISALLIDVKIEWWSNISYLFIGEVQVPFDSIEVSGCWPNKFKSNINFIRNGKTCCIVPLTEY